MGIIRQLPREVVERIAAGEVVERPASVVKELVENAIDAGATSITVDVKDGGRNRIVVIDDGCGMDSEDLSLCAIRHATSKISRGDDLWDIRTMGFRGEALAAIGAVSRLTIESRPNRPEVIEGTRLEVEGGAIKGPIPAGCAGGTKVIVSDLFFNVPARLKFLRSAAVEFGHIFETVSDLALAFPTIRFEFVGDGKQKFVLAAGDQAERAVSVLGDRFRGSLISVKEGGEFLCIEGLVAPTGRDRGKDIHIFVNRRPVRDRIITHAVTAAFGEQLDSNKYPAAALWIDIDPSKVDVNVHPTKREVRFSNAGAVHDFVMHAVRKSVECHTSCVTRYPPASRTLGERAGALRVADDRTGNVENAILRYEQSRLSIARDDGRPFTSFAGAKDTKAVSSFVPARGAGERPSSLGSFRPLGQLSSTYVICEGDDGALVLIDQHAAHERLGFNALRAQYAAGRVAQQHLLVPEQVELGSKEQAYVMENIDVLAKAGFEVEPFGGATLLVKAVPAILGDASVAPFFTKIAAELEELGASHTIEEVIDRIFAVVACHRQVRAGDRLSSQELEALVRDIECENITHCPHGRPAVVRIERGEIEKWFKRRQ